MSTRASTSKHRIPFSNETEDRRASEQRGEFQGSMAGDRVLAPNQERPPSIESAYGMLHHLGMNKRTSISGMREAVRRRAMKKHSAL